MFLKRIIYERGIPFEIKEPKPSKELLEALEEGKQIIEDIKSGKRTGYTDVHQMFQDILKEEDWFMKKYIVDTTTKFKKQLRKVSKQGKDLKKLEDIVIKISNGEK